MRKLKSILASLAICLVFTTTSFANVNLETKCNETVVNEISYEPSVVVTNVEFGSDIVLIKDGEFWRNLMEFLIGVGKGLDDKPMPINSGNNNSDISDEQIKKFAIEQVRTKKNAMRIFREIQKLIESEKETVSKNEILEIFNPKSSGRPNPRWLQEILDDIFKGGKIDNDSHTRPNIKPTKRLLKSSKLKKRKIKKHLTIEKPNYGDEISPKKKINWERVGWVVGRILKFIL